MGRGGWIRARSGFSERKRRTTNRILEAAPPSLAIVSRRRGLVADVCTTGVPTEWASGETGASTDRSVCTHVNQARGLQGILAGPDDRGPKFLATVALPPLSGQLTYPQMTSHCK